MKRSSTIVALALLLGLAAVIVTAPFHFGYYSDYNGLLQEIRARPGLEVIDGWRNEDMTLEEMGFTLRSSRATLALSLSERGVRRARDSADGIAFPTGRFRSAGNVTGPEQGYIRFESDDWNLRGLPKVRTLGDVLDHFDAIAYSLQTTPPIVVGWNLPGDYINLGPPPRSASKERPMPVPTDIEKFWKRWSR